MKNFCVIIEQIKMKKYLILAVIAAVSLGLIAYNSFKIQSSNSPISFGASVMRVIQGGTGASTLTGCLEGNGTSPITGTGSPCGSGSGSGGGAGAHSTSTAWGSTLYVRPNNATDIYALGYDGSGVATSSNEAEYVADPTAKIASYLNGMKLGIGTTSPYAALSVVGEVVGSFFTSTTIATSTFAGPLKITNNHNDQYMLGVIAGGNIGSASALVQNGALVVDNTLNTLTPGFYLSSDQAGVPSNPMGIIRSTSASYNQGLLWLLGASTNTGGAAYGLKVQDGNPDIEFVESDQTAPAGKYEIDVNNDNIRINGRNTAENSFDSIALFARNDKGGTGQGGRFCIGCGFSDSGLENSRVNIIRNPSNTSMSYLTLSTASTGPAMGDIFNVTNDGNVGINNATPTSKLHLVDTQTANTGTLNGQYIGQTFTPTSSDYSSGANGLYIQSSLGAGTAVSSTNINSFVRGIYAEGPSFATTNIHATYGITGSSGTGVGSSGNVGNAYGSHGYIYSNGSGNIVNAFPIFSECRQTGTGSMGTCVGFYGDISYTTGSFPAYVGIKIPSYRGVASSTVSALFGDSGSFGTTTPFFDQYTLTIASSTSPQLSLSAGAGLPQWTIRNAGGDFFLSTSTVAGTATTTKSALSITNGGVYSISTSTAGFLKVTSTGDLFTATSAGGGSSVGPVNTLQASNGAGGFIATGTPILTVGSIIATTTTQSTFGGAISTPNTLILGNTPAVRSLNTSNGLSLQGVLSSVAGYETILTSNGNTQTFTSGTGGTTNVINTYAPTSGTGVYNALNVIPTLNQTGGANGITRGLYINPVLTAVADFRALEVSVGKSIFNDVIGVGTSTPFGFYSATLASSTAPQLSLSAGGGLAQWVFRNAGGNLYIASTTVAGTATTTTSAFSIIGATGEVATRFLSVLTKFVGVIAAAFTPSTEGEMGIDTTSNQLKYYASSAVRVIAPDIDSAFVLATSSMGTGTTTIKTAGFSRASTFTKWGCSSRGSGTFVAQFGDGTSSSTAVVSATGNTTTFTTISSNNAFTAGEAIWYAIGSVSGTVIDPSCSYNRNITAD